MPCGVPFTQPRPPLVTAIRIEKIRIARIQISTKMAPLNASHKHCGPKQSEQPESQVTDEELMLLEEEAILQAGPTRMRLQPVHDFYLALSRWELGREARVSALGSLSTEMHAMDAVQSRRVIGLLLKLYSGGGSAKGTVNVTNGRDCFFAPGGDKSLYLGFDE
ncbi:hypothetical protein BC830DRAFT_813435 [Chytriomyces sp. MP71]|nr:hypothetical protein BC830DRAFT_813435 [Chytriomyces sp. MP71]